ncbi:amidohydrolase family protein [Aliiglaciecola litoralis]|uniref:Amidohydrolase-related domain-containing protein n=1 Tax=Aliiglaciecola litoralis TaxID=582857 RepID=A0ABP3WY46_9ALTE
MIRYIFLLVTALVVIGLSVLISILPTSVQSPEQVIDTDLAARGNTYFISQTDIFDGLHIIKNQNVRIHQGIISEIGPELIATPDEVLIDGSGKTLIPGLIDAHTHSFGNGLSDTLRFGVTTHLDMFTMEHDLHQTKAKRDSREFSSEADLFSAGTMATVEGGHGTQYGFAIDTIDSIDEVPQWVSQRKAAGADYIKLVYMPNQDYMPSLTREVAAEVIRVGQAEGLLVVAHISTQAAAMDMIEAGIDGLVHIFADQVASDEIVSLAAQKGLFIIPTLAIIASVDEQQLNVALAENPQVKARLSAEQNATLVSSFGSHLPGYDLDIAKQNVKRFFDAGVTILAGSDAPNPGTAYGVSTHHEMQLLVAAGMTPTQALSAATQLPAKHFSLQNRGRIEQGTIADLVLVNGDPTVNIVNTLDIEYVFKNGYVITISTKLAKGATLSSPLLGDFEDANKLVTAESFVWSHSDDKMANGQSIGTIKRIAEGAGDSAGALRVSAKVNVGFPYPWAGAAVGDFIPPVEGFDITQYSTLSFDVKGTAGTYRVLSFNADMAGIPPSQSFIITPQWQRIELDLAKFNGLNHKAFSGFAFVAGPGLGEFEFVLDNVQFEKR